MAVGMPGFDSVLIFARNETLAWNLQAVVVADNVPENFGIDVALDETQETLVVGANYDGAGTAYVFVRSLSGSGIGITRKRPHFVSQSLDLSLHSVKAGSSIIMNGLLPWSVVAMLHQVQIQVLGFIQCLANVRDGTTACFHTSTHDFILEERE